MSFVIEDYYNIMDKYDNCSDRKTMMNEFLNCKREGIQYKEFLKGFIFLDNIKKQKWMMNVKQ